MCVRAYMCSSACGDPFMSELFISTYNDCFEGIRVMFSMSWSVGLRK